VLTPDEEQAIELKHDPVAGQERVVWNHAFTVPPKEFDLNDTQVARLKAALETWGGYAASPDRCWLQPLAQAIFSNEPQRQAVLLARLSWSASLDAPCERSTRLSGGELAKFKNDRSESFEDPPHDNRRHG